MTRFCPAPLLLACALLLNGCQSFPCTFQPEICYIPQARHIEALPSPFPEFTEEELSQEWSKELSLGVSFAHEMDLYRAITCLKRALFLLPEGYDDRRAQIEYEIILCYYLGSKYQEAIEYFEASSLTCATSSGFPGYRTLLIVLYDSYQEANLPDRAQKVLELIEMHEPEAAEDLTLYSALYTGCIVTEDYVQNDCETDADDRRIEPVDQFLARYEADTLSPGYARTLNAVLPGAGYLYVGQKSTAFTSFVLNGLFTWAAYQAFHHHQIAAGVILSGFEVGWYLGGINGAGLAATQYNERLYEERAKDYMICEGLFPVLMFSFAF
jgi:tetratricopeptide (TPR) repeat protein